MNLCNTKIKKKLIKENCNRKISEIAGIKINYLLLKFLI